VLGRIVEVVAVVIDYSPGTRLIAGLGRTSVVGVMAFSAEFLLRREPVGQRVASKRMLLPSQKMLVSPFPNGIEPVPILGHAHSPW
jgi:hypothetical protein